MFKAKGLRAYTTGWLVCFTLVSSLLFLAVGVITAYIVEDAIISRLVNEQAQGIETSLQRGEQPQLSAQQQLFTKAGDLPPQWRERVLSSRYGELFTDTNDHYHFQHLSLRDSPQGIRNGVLQTSDGELRVLVVEVSRMLVVSNSPGAFLVFVFVFVLLTLVAVFVALKIANRVTKPVLDLSAAVSQRANAASPMPQLPFELNALAATFEASFSKIERMLQRERDFTTDVGHELKTPLTAFNNLLVMANGRALTAAEVDQLERINAELANTVEVLLALAREESLAQESINVMGCIEQLAIEQPQVLSGEFSIDLSGDHSLVINGNRVLSQLLFLNLIQNAIRHANSPHLFIELAANKLSFRNQTKPLKQTNVMAPGVRNDTSSGVGQGLYLVRRIAEKLALTTELKLNDSQFEIVFHIN